jgi:hypothetical protein
MQNDTSNAFLTTHTDFLTASVNDTLSECQQGCWVKFVADSSHARLTLIPYDVDTTSNADSIKATASIYLYSASMTLIAKDTTAQNYLEDSTLTVGQTYYVKITHARYGEFAFDFYASKYNSYNPCNRNNPFDFIGAYHNMGLEYAIDNKDRLFTSDTLLWNLNAMQLASEFACIHKNDIGSYAINAYGKISGEIDTTKCGMSAVEYENVSKISRLINNVDTTAAGMKNFIDSVKSIEKRVMKSNTLSKQEKISILSAIPVARYSVMYWYDESLKMDANDSKWTLPTPVATTILQDALDDVKGLGKADYDGAVTFVTSPVGI